MNTLIKFLTGVLLLTTVACVPNTENKSVSTIEVGQIKTRFGNIWIALHDATPQHKASFLKLAKEGYWDSLTFNRVIPGFVAQGGCPDTPEGFADSPYLMDAELVDSLRHVYGAVGAGRDDNPEKKSAACQFYIVQAKEGIARLDGDYTIFGQVFSGMQLVDSIVSVQRDSLDAPFQPVTLDIDIVELPLAVYDSLQTAD